MLTDDGRLTTLGCAYVCVVGVALHLAAIVWVYVLRRSEP